MLFLTSATFPHYGLERFFAFAKKTGFSGVEIVVNQNFDTQNAQYLQKLATEYNITIGAFTLPEKNMEKYLKPFQEVVKNFPNTHINLPSAEVFSFEYKHWIEKVIPKVAKKYQLKFHRKNSIFKLLLGFIPLRQENSLYALRQAGTVSLDLSALQSSNQDIIRSLNFLGSKLRHVYLSNVFHGKSYNNLTQGLLPLESFLTKLAQKDFSGDFTLKLSAKAIHEGDEEKMEELLIKNREFFEKYFKKS